MFSPLKIPLTSGPLYFPGMISFQFSDTENAIGVIGKSVDVFLSEIMFQHVDGIMFTLFRQDVHRHGRRGLSSLPFSKLLPITPGCDMIKRGSGVFVWHTAHEVPLF
jgi:hypothetical protein